MPKSFVILLVALHFFSNCFSQTIDAGSGMYDSAYFNNLSLDTFHVIKENSSLFSTTDAYFDLNDPRKVTIKQSLSFSDCVFIGELRYFFRQSTDFWSCRFKDQFNFTSTFDTSLSVSSCLLGTVHVTNASFANTTFHFCTFNKLNIVRCEFNGNIAFSSCEFQHGIFFYGGKFRPDATMSFDNCLFPDTITFDKIQSGTVDLSINNGPLKSGNRINISFLNCDISRFKLDYQQFHLYFDTSWDQNDDAKESIYEALLNNFRTRGQLESYQLLDIEYHDFKYKSHWYTYPLAWLNFLWWNYGYSKSLVFAWTAAFLLIFTVITYQKLGHLNSVVYKMKNIPITTSTDSKGDRWWYSFIYTSSIFFKLTLKLEDLEFKEKRWTMYVILVYALGVVCLAYMANFVLQK